MLSSQTLGQKIEYTFSVPGDTTKNYYVTVFPNEKIKGAIQLRPLIFLRNSSCGVAVTLTDESVLIC